FAAPEAVAAVSAVYLLLPQIPMLFMGEEWATETPFPFFCDFSGDLAEAIRNGRREEFRHFPAFRDEAARDRIPDPTAEKTFASAKLDWSETASPEHAASLERTRQILSLRRTDIIPLVASMGPSAGRYEILGRQAISVNWTTADGQVLRLDANLKGEQQGGFGAVTGREIWQEGDMQTELMGPWSVRWSVQTS
ncbi:MAG: DUF3459 domain-containing protein, partial [Janthinobacterium lividum]